MPYMILGKDFSLNLRNVTIPVSAVMVLALIGLIVFFMVNYKMLKLLEMEDWPALAFYLEDQIYNKNKYSSRKVKLLASSYMVISDYQSVITLESRALGAKPAAVYKNILIFTAARMLANNKTGAAVSVQNYNDKRIKKNDRQWLRWFNGFSQTLAGNFQAAEQDFTFLAENSGDVLITGLSAYLLGSICAKRSINKEGCLKIADNGKERVRKAVLGIKGWKKQVAAVENEIHTTIIRKYIDEAGIWCFMAAPGGK